MPTLNSLEQRALRSPIPRGREWEGGVRSFPQAIEVPIEGMSRKTANIEINIPESQLQNQGVQKSPFGSPSSGRTKNIDPEDQVIDPRLRRYQSTSFEPASRHASKTNLADYQPADLSTDCQIQNLRCELRNSNHAIVKRNEQISVLEEQLQAARAKTAPITQALQECKEKIFELQPQPELADLEIGDYYERLNEMIKDWVDNDFDEMTDFLGNIEIDSLEPSPGRILEHIFTREEIEITRQSRTAHMFGLEYLIHAFLAIRVFWPENLAPSLPSEYEDFLQDLKAGVEKQYIVEGRKGTRAARGWKAETYKAILHHQGYVELRDQYIDGTARELETIFLNLLPVADRLGFRQGKCEKIVQYAFELDAKLRSHMETFRFAFELRTDRITPSQVVKIADIPRVRMIDEATIRTIRKDSPVISGEGGRIGICLFQSIPSLIRDGQQGEEDVLIRKPEVLVRLDRPMVKRRKRVAEDAGDRSSQGKRPAHQGISSFTGWLR